jgi:hypothetical protein
VELTQRKLGDVPHPRVFFVRVANKGVRLDAASRIVTAGLKVFVFSGRCVKPVRVGAKGLSERRLTVEILELERPRLGPGLAVRWTDRQLAAERGDFNAEGTEFTEVGGRRREWWWRSENEKRARKADPSLRSG